ncbi:MAG: hypothetical protein HYU47_05975 [Deltaproteobacteria bacterium]|nr:hypothetical protein [Deltaproteobacteria bacterium]MBI3061388.1 hypothetical protein [Deltaproteobacteria bacterium]
MSIRMMNPVAKPYGEAFRRPVPIEELDRRRLGLLFNGHVSSVKFWRHLEVIVSELYHPLSVASLRKENTFAPAAAGGEIAELKSRTDLVLVGVGA